MNNTEKYIRPVARIFLKEAQYTSDTTMLCAGGHNKYFNCHSSTKILILVIIQQQSRHLDFNSTWFSMFARPSTYGSMYNIHICIGTSEN